VAPCAYLDREDRLPIRACCRSARGGCGEDEQTATRDPAAPSLRPAPAAVARACQQATGRAAFPVVCPSQWPPHGGAGQPKLRSFGRTADAYLLDASNGFSRRKTHVFHLLVGGQRRPFGRWPSGVDSDLRVTTHKVVIPERGGGTFVQHLPARRIATARVHGAPATVLREPPFPTGGIHGDHVLVLWNEGGHGYMVSVHGERLSRPALVSVALAMARSARPSPERRGSG
jgi:hypothetical protein